MQTYKTTSEIAELLAVRIDEKHLKLDPTGNKYVPWDYSLRELLHIFGPFGFDTEIVSQQSFPDQGLYAATLKLTVRAYDPDTKIVVEASRTGVGRSVAQATKAEREEQGLTVTKNLKIHDTAIAAAASDALSRAVKQLGDAFGAFLYDKGDPAHQSSTPSYQKTDTRQTPATSGGNGEGRPTEKMSATLKKAGAPEGLVDSMSYGDAKAAIDKVAKNGWKWDANFSTAPAPTKNSPAKAPVAQASSVDDLDDIFG